MRDHSRVLAYVLPTGLAVAAVQTWFQPGTVIAWGDLGPPVAPGWEYISHWNHLWNGTGGPSYSISQFPYFGLLNAGQAMGVSAELLQRVWLSTLFAGSAFAGAFLTLSVTRSPIAGGVGGLLLAFNAYRLVLGPDPISLATLVLAGLLGGILLRAAVASDSGARHAAAFALVSIGLSYVAANPPHILVLLIWVLACTAVAWAVGGRRAFLSAWALLAKAAPLVLLVNLWWVAPAVLTISSASFQEQFTAGTPSSWAWTHQRASLVNGISLNTAWGWKEPAYFPYASRLDRLPVAQLRLFLPALALVGLVAAKKPSRRIAAAFAIVALLGVLIAKGYHPPLTELNAWLYEHVPGYWLLRDPMKALLLTTLAFSVLGGIAVDRLIRLRSSLRLAGITLAVALVAGTIAYVHPIYTGEVIPDRRPPLPPAHVQLPGSWLEAARFINARRGGRVLVLPAADYYQLRTTWGYYGAPFTAQAIHKPVIELTPGGYLSQAGSVSELVVNAQQRILAGDGEQALRALRALGVQYLVLRHDLDPGESLRPTAPTIALSRQLGRGLLSVPGVRPLRSFDQLVLYELAAGEGRDVYPSLPVPFAGSSMDVSSALDGIGSTYSLVENSDLIVESPSQDQVASPGGEVRFLRSEAERLWEAWVVSHSSEHTLRLLDPLRIKVDEANVPRLRPIEVNLGGDPPFVVEIGGNSFAVDRHMNQPVRLGLLRLTRGASVRLWQRQDVHAIRLSNASPVRDCDPSGDWTPEQVGLSSSVSPIDGVPTLELSAREHVACVRFPVEPVDPAALYRLTFDYRAVDGERPRACLYQEVIESCAPVPTLDPSPGWHRMDEVITLDPQTTGLKLFFYADGAGEGRTRTQYRKTVISHFELTEERSLPERGTRPLGEVNLPEGLLPIEIQSPLEQPHQVDLMTAGPVGDCNRYDDRTQEQVGLSSSVSSMHGVPTLELSAREHAACVSFPIEPVDPAALYRLTFDYRAVDGDSPRACLYQEGVDRCAPVPALDPSPGWHRMDEVIPLDPKTRGLRLFFYADGTGDGVTINQFRDVRVSAVPPADPVLLGLPASSIELPHITYIRVGPAEVRAQVNGATGPFLLVLTESFAPGWRIEVPGRDAAAVRHVRVDGYANGWLTPWEGTYQVRFIYGPEGIARFARWTGLILVPALMGVLLLGGRRYRGNHERRWPWTRRRTT